MTEPTSTLTIAGQAAGEVVTPKLRELLFGPTAKAYGDHWGAITEERLKRKRAKREANIVSHLELVAAAGNFDSFSDVFDNSDFGEWVEGAADVDANADPDLAEFWRAALLAIRRGDASRLRLLNIVRQIDRSDAAFLVAGHIEGHAFVAPATGRSGSSILDRIARAGVVETGQEWLLRLVLRFAPFFLMLFIPYFAIDILSISENLKLLDLFKRTALAVALSMLVFGALGVPTLYRRNRRRLTEDGERLFAVLATIKAASAPEADSAHA